MNNLVCGSWLSRCASVSAVRRRAGNFAKCGAWSDKHCIYNCFTSCFPAAGTSAIL